MENQRESLYEALKEYSQSEVYPMHMPGHKRNQTMMQMMNPYAIDITEVEGFDNLHDAQEILQKGMARAAKLYRSEETFYLVNGSTVGLLAAVAACTKRGDKILVARNCHKAVYNAIYLNELEPIYVYPQQIVEFNINGGISPEIIEKMLIKHPDAKLVVITSPTYEGVVSDVKKIAEIVHKRSIPLLVDEAHGAHFGFHKAFPESAVQNGADIVVQSLHKTFPSFTQTSLLHRNGSLVKREILQMYLSIYQSSSPSYVLMSGIDQCVRIIEQEGMKLFEEYHIRLQRFYERILKLEHIQLYYDENNSRFDRSKLVLSVKDTNMSGPELYQRLLTQYQIQMEMVSKDYVLGMTSICDSEEGFHRLEQALVEIDETLVRESSSKVNEKESLPLKIALSCYEAYNRASKTIALAQSEGGISREYVYLYPPGIPLLVPGEVISRALLDDLMLYQKKGLTVMGLADKENRYIQVVQV